MSTHPFPPSTYRPVAPPTCLARHRPSRPCTDVPAPDILPTSTDLHGPSKSVPTTATCRPLAPLPHPTTHRHTTPPDDPTRDRPSRHCVTHLSARHAPTCRSKPPHPTRLAPPRRSTGQSPSLLHRGDPTPCAGPRPSTTPDCALQTTPIRPDHPSLRAPPSTTQPVTALATRHDAPARPIPPRRPHPTHPPPTRTTPLSADHPPDYPFRPIANRLLTTCSRQSDDLPVSGRTTPTTRRRPPAAVPYDLPTPVSRLVTPPPDRHQPAPTSQLLPRRPTGLTVTEHTARRALPILPTPARHADPRPPNLTCQHQAARPCPGATQTDNPGPATAPPPN